VLPWSAAQWEFGMIIASPRHNPLIVGEIITPAKLVINSQELKPQPLRVVREATYTDYLEQGDSCLDSSPDYWVFHEVETD
jgi:hypothetical protein